MSTTPHHRHQREERESNSRDSNEGTPLLFRHLSMEDAFQKHGTRIKGMKRSCLHTLAALTLLILVSSVLVYTRKGNVIVPIERAQENLLDIGNGLSLWYRTWGDRQSGIPVLFVHGGPGNAVQDYHDGNKRFFAASKFFVVEVDQRGTGKSQPSVRDDWRNMAYYQDISIDKMSHDFELVRQHLEIDKWLVFGGSWGSTLSLDYGMRYPERCLALILRGIYLNTVPEFNDVFSRQPYLNNPKRLGEFDTWFELAAEDAIEAGESQLDPNDARRFFQIYERMIERGDRHAIWRYHVFENNLMEEDPKNLLDPNRIVEATFPEAQSVAFFETRLFLRGTFEEPVDLLERVDRLRTVHTFVCQGSRDLVCPPQYAHRLVDALKSVHAPHTARFIESGHEDTDPVMEECLQRSLDDFTDSIYE